MMICNPCDQIERCRTTRSKVQQSFRAFNKRCIALKWANLRTSNALYGKDPHGCDRFSCNGTWPGTEEQRFYVNNIMLTLLEEGCANQGTSNPLFFLNPNPNSPLFFLNPNPNPDSGPQASKPNPAKICVSQI